MGGLRVCLVARAASKEALDEVGSDGDERSARAVLGVLRWVSVDNDANGAVLVGEGVDAVERWDDLWGGSAEVSENRVRS